MMLELYNGLEYMSFIIEREDLPALIEKSNT